VNIRASKCLRSAAGLPLALLWSSAVALGMLALTQYQMTPGPLPQKAPANWPAEVNDIPRKPERFTLVMLLHPQCPCSRASLHELSQLMARTEGHVDAHILFVKPLGADSAWCDGDLWKQAQNIPDATVSVDNDGKDAGIFKTNTSGQVIVYDPSGAICFSGGITDGRGHEGDNTGLSAILGLIHDGQTSVKTTPVYGCSLNVCAIKK
jgi:hypothetical protein